VKEIPGSVKKQENRGLFYLFLYHIFGVKVQEITWNASYAKSKTHLTNNPHLRHPIMGKGQAPQNQRMLPPIRHLRRKQDEAIPPSRHVRKDIIDMKPEQDKTLQRVPKTRENNVTAPSADREERIKVLLADTLTEKRTEPQTQKGCRGRRSWGSIPQLLVTFWILGQAKKVV